MSSDDERPTLAALYVRNREVMLRAAWAILRNQHDAEDAVSVAVVKVAARLATGHVPDEPDGYLIQAVRHAALDHLRAAARRRDQRQDKAEESTVQSALAGTPHALADIIDSTPDIADLIIERQRSMEVREAVQRAIDRLANRERTMLALLLDGYTRADIGALFNLTGQRVGQLLKKPIADLLAELGIAPAGRDPQPAAGERR
ncbi:MAG TPA: sigma-70 family RNA polymerase sigma factor [Micromonosporaceae bacterium]|nr:sigma-70 family RNA polymerase sigma factor [Micromonosporaceae bacterium]